MLTFLASGSPTRQAVRDANPCENRNWADKFELFLREGIAIGIIGGFGS